MGRVPSCMQGKASYRHKGKGRSQGQKQKHVCWLFSGAAKRFACRVYVVGWAVAKGVEGMPQGGIQSKVWDRGRQGHVWGGAAWCKSVHASVCMYVSFFCAMCTKWEGKAVCLSFCLKATEESYRYAHI